MIALDFSVHVEIAEGMVKPLGSYLLAVVGAVASAGGPDLRQPQGLKQLSHENPMVNFGVGTIRGAALMLGLQPHELVAKLDAWKASR